VELSFQSGHFLIIGRDRAISALNDLACSPGDCIVLESLLESFANETFTAFYFLDNCQVALTANLVPQRNKYSMRLAKDGAVMRGLCTKGVDLIFEFLAQSHS
jgi:hypothetical protein